MTLNDILNAVGYFSYDHCGHFFVETPYGNFIWNDPDYGGDNTFTPVAYSAADYAKHCQISLRDKGYHVIHEYCGRDIILK